MHAQFVMVPPFSRIGGLFKKLTDQDIVVEATWKVWKSVELSAYESFRPYIRPSHQRLLDETIAGKEPTAFLRQLLRPYNYLIEKKPNNKGWVVKLSRSGVSVQDGTTITWE